MRAARALSLAMLQIAPDFSDDTYRSTSDCGSESEVLGRGVEFHGVEREDC
jgi:hypothetical protein